MRRIYEYTQIRQRPGLKALFRLKENLRLAQLSVASARNIELFEGGNLFAYFCATEVLVPEGQNTIISQMLNARKELRKLAMCEKLIDKIDALNLNNYVALKVLKNCAKL